MNRDILKIAIPNIISNITVPLMGIASTAIAGRLGSDSAMSIGQLAIGVSIFNFIYWNCSFVRMGTSGITAQAFGAGEFSETTRMLVRALLVAMLLGVVILIFRDPIARGAVRLMGGGELALEYVLARSWAIPAGILLFAFHGWYTGMQSAVIPMAVAITVNLLHIGFSYYLAIVKGWGIEGVAYASVVAQWSGVALSALLLYTNFREKLTAIDIPKLFDRSVWATFFSVNRDIMIRTFCIVCVYTFFTAASARMDNASLLAVNTLLLQMFTLFSYMTDGFAYAAEALTGRFIGAKDRGSLKRAINLSIRWSLVVSVIFVGCYILGWRDILSLFVTDEASRGQILALAQNYIGWIIAIPIASATPFLMDGVMVGATYTHIMRNSMIISMVGFFALYYGFYPSMGNDALWLAFTSFMFLRGVVGYFMTDRFRQIYDCASR
ncbi:MAG: MATE family efflux transporter [Rikenellaceae bacterium]